jgi:hypothetical protein
MTITGPACQPGEPTAPSATPTNNPTSVPTPTATPAPPTNTPAPINTPTPTIAISPPPEPTAEITLVDIFSHPRLVDADVIWSEFILVQGTENPQAFSQYLAMWDDVNPCYSELQSTVAELGSGNMLDPIAHIKYVDATASAVSSCVEEQLQQTDAGEFFTYSDDERNKRIERLFNSAWNIMRVGDRILFPECRDGFYAHVAPVTAATDSDRLHLEFGSASEELFGCYETAVQTKFPWFGAEEISALPAEQRGEALSSQMIGFGHMMSLGFEIPYAVCSAQYEAHFPSIAQIEESSELETEMSAAHAMLYNCFQLAKLTEESNATPNPPSAPTATP